MILDLRQSLTRELLELRIAAVLDLLSEERRISFLILDLAIHIVAVERGAVVRLNRGNSRDISVVQKLGAEPKSCDVPCRRCSIH